MSFLDKALDRVKALKSDPKKLLLFGVLPLVGVVAVVVILVVVLSSLGNGYDFSQDITAPVYNPSHVSSESSSSESEPEPIVPLPVDEEVEAKYKEAQETSEDVVAYLQIPGTPIDYPIMQAERNDYYMERDINGQYFMYGSVFAHKHNDVSSDEALDRNTVLFGHNKDIANLSGDQHNFSTLLYFQDQDYAKEHRYFTLNIGDKVTYWVIFAALDSANKENHEIDSDFYYWNPEPDDEAAWLKTLAMAMDRSYWDYGLEVKAEDRVLTMSTCSYDWGYDGGYNTYAKFVLMARELREDELAQGMKFLEELPELKANEDRFTPAELGLTRKHYTTEAGHADPS